MTAARLPTAVFAQSVTNIADLVFHCAQAQPDTRALVDLADGSVRTYAQLARDIETTAVALLEAGLEKGDRCALFISRGPSFVTNVFACFCAGIIPVLIDPGMGVANMVSCIKEQQPRGLLGIAKAHVLRLLKRDAFKSVEVKILADGGFFPGTYVLSKLRRADAALDQQHRTRVGNVAAVLYTSGSTGAPKGVLYTHAMLAAQTRAIRDMFDIQPGEVDVACFLPFALFSVGMGMTAVFPEMDFRYPKDAKPQRILEALQNAHSAFASPALWTPFAEFLTSRGVKLKLRRLLIAGAPVSPVLFESLLTHLPGGDVFTPYGATEALPVSFMSGRSVVSETAQLTRAGWGLCVGNLAPGIEVKIIALSDEPIASIDRATELEQGEIGEIIVRGPCVTVAYDPASARGRRGNELSKIVDGMTVWHRMGDAGHMDARGRLWFCGRKNHRVTLDDTVLHSVCVEGPVEGLTRTRAALVGPTVNGAVVPTVIHEARGRPNLKMWQRLHDVTAVRGLPGCERIERTLAYPHAFPVDRRHNAKIDREQLQAWAQQELSRSLLAPAAAATTP